MGGFEKGGLGARQHSGCDHGVVMDVTEQADGVVLHWKMCNVSEDEEGGGPGSGHRSYQFQGRWDWGFTGAGGPCSKFLAGVGGGGLRRSI